MFKGPKASEDYIQVGYHEKPGDLPIPKDSTAVILYVPGHGDSAKPELKKPQWLITIIHGSLCANLTEIFKLPRDPDIKHTPTLYVVSADFDLMNHKGTKVLIQQEADRCKIKIPYQETKANHITITPEGRLEFELKSEKRPNHEKAKGSSISTKHLYLY